VTPEDRAWEVVRRAYEERVPAPRRSHRRRTLAVVLVAALVVVAAFASPPGRAVLGSLRDSVAIVKTEPALFSLPAPGRLLVVSSAHGGVWVVNRDGSKRRLGDYLDATWSPHGLFVVATRENELVALEPDGTERWSLARPAVRFPRWTGSRVDTLIAYCTATGLRVVAGDGRGDRLVSPRACESAWRPGPRRVLTYLDRGVVVAQDVDARKILWRSAGGGELEWSSDGKRLAVVAPHAVRVVDANGRPLRTLRFRQRVLGAAFRPRTHEVAVQLRRGAARPRSEIRLYAVDGRASQRLFGADGVFGDIAWAPDGRWLLVDWPSASQWLFVPRTGRARAVSNLAGQFPRPDDGYPRFELAQRWCCPQ
jgi:hypothetical protein